MTDLARLSAAEGARRLAAGSLTAETWAEALLERSAARQPEIAAWITLDPAGALQAARAADAAIRRDGPRAPLHGVPLGLKDCLDTAGLRTTGHSRRFLDQVPDSDAALVSRLREVGAVILGKQAMYELSYGGPSFDLPFPPARNPWNPERIPGGSSSGSAAAVADGQAPVSVGTDAGGSIRQPAAYCGVVGLKPTLGLVPRSGVLPLTFTLGEPGPLARTVEDCALLLDAIAGTATAPQLSENLAGLRVGVLRTFFAGPAVRASEAVVDAVEGALSLFATLGARLEDAVPPDPHLLDACGRVILLSEAFANHEAQLRNDPAVYGRLARHRFALGAFLSAADLLQAQRQRQRLAAAMDALFDRYDVLACAGEVSGAPFFADTVGDSFPFTQQPSLRIPFNVTGHPALVLPCGFDAAGMPLSLQLVGRRGGEVRLLAAAHALEARLGCRDAQPPASVP
ncbi:amidase [Roseomonas sp. BN140053]|uniref:amidase n=1 Tax=Roseomonas sp. BN140053 TaxID=3391898 RepID=UPI0039EB76E9